MSSRKQGQVTYKEAFNELVTYLRLYAPKHLAETYSFPERISNRQVVRIVPYLQKHRVFVVIGWFAIIEYKVKSGYDTADFAELQDIVEYRIHWFKDRRNPLPSTASELLLECCIDRTGSGWDYQGYVEDVLFEALGLDVYLDHDDSELRMNFGDTQNTMAVLSAALSGGVISRTDFIARTVAHMTPMMKALVPGYEVRIQKTRKPQETKKEEA